MYTNFTSLENLSKALDDFEEAARATDASRKRWTHQFTANPDCRDPEHPGCPKCWETSPELPDADIESDCV